jgi:hypothetical protein
MPDFAASLNQFPFLTFAEQATSPAAPAEGLVLVYRKTDGKLYVQDSAGTETELGAGGGGGGGWISTIPSDNNATGTAGQYAANESWLYVCVSTNTWRRAGLVLFGTVELTYVSDTDTNGVLYYLGTNMGLIAWSNPHTLGTVHMFMSSIGAGSAANLSDRVANNTYTSAASTEFYGIDLKAGRTLLCKRYAIRMRNDPSNMLRTWVVEGSNNVADSSNTTSWNAATWTTIDSRSGDTTMTTSGQIASWVPATQTTAYRFFRIRQTGVNSNGSYFFGLSDFELWGTFSF